MFCILKNGFMIVIKEKKAFMIQILGLNCFLPTSSFGCDKFEGCQNLQVF